MPNNLVEAVGAFELVACPPPARSGGFRGPGRAELRPRLPESSGGRRARSAAAAKNAVRSEIMPAARSIVQPQHIGPAMVEDDRLRLKLKLASWTLIDRRSLRGVQAAPSQRQQGQGEQTSDSAWLALLSECTHQRIGAPTRRCLTKRRHERPFRRCPPGSADAQALVWPLLLFAAVLLPAPRLRQAGAGSGSSRSATSMAIMTPGWRSPARPGWSTPRADGPAATTCWCRWATSSTAAPTA